MTEKRSQTYTEHRLVTLIGFDIGTDEIKNETVSVLSLLDILNVQGAHVTVDGMNSQKRVVGKIKQRRGDYTLYIKGKHQNLRDINQGLLPKMKREEGN